MTELAPLTSGQLQALFREARYVADPLALFAQLTSPADNSLLLESAEIDTKAGTQSLLLLDACARLTCRGLVVDVEALNANGQAVLALLAAELPPQVEKMRDGNTLQLRFPATDTAQDEDSRLKALSVLDSLRVLLTRVHCAQGQEAIFLGGIFAYDLIADFETLPTAAQSSNDCPDFCFYVAETLIHIDHLRQRTDLRALAFGGVAFAEESARLQSRLTELQQACEQFVPPAPPVVSPLQGQLTVDKDDKAFCADVERLKGNIRKGDIFQVVPSRCFSLPCPEPLSYNFV